MQILESPGIPKAHFPGLRSPGIRPKSWNVMEVCLDEIDELENRGTLDTK